MTTQGRCDWKRGVGFDGDDGFAGRGIGAEQARAIAANA